MTYTLKVFHSSNGTENKKNNFDSKIFSCTLLVHCECFIVSRFDLNFNCFCYFNFIIYVYYYLMIRLIQPPKNILYVFRLIVDAVSTVYSLFLENRQMLNILSMHKSFARIFSVF